MTPLVQLHGAAFGYDDTVVLSNVDATISSGEFVAIVGPNGAGKSTLVKGILGLVNVAEGGVDLFGTPSGDFKQRWRIGYVPQRQTIGGPIPATVQEVVSSGRLARRRMTWSRSASERQAVDAAMERVQIADLANRPVMQLSGGQQRRVLVARALAGDAELLLLDEPTAGVDVDAQAAVVNVLSTLRDDGVTIAVVTHDLEPFKEQLTRVLWVSRGKVSYDGPPTDAIVAAASEPFSHHDQPESPRRDSMPDDLRTGG